MPKRNLTIHPYDLPGGASQTDVLVTLELVDSSGVPQPGYQLDTAEGVVGTYQNTIRSESVTLSISTTEGLTPTLYWLFKAYWGSTSGYRRYTSGLITLGDGGDLVLPEFLALEMVPGSEAGLTQAEIDAIKGANDPWGGNPFATMEDLEDVGGGHVIYDDGVELPQRLGLEFVGATVTDDDATNKTVVSGLTGADGADGADGVDGAPGADGADGADGIQGDPGQDGAQGEQGPQGEQGVEGPSAVSADADNQAVISANDSLIYVPKSSPDIPDDGNMYIGQDGDWTLLNWTPYAQSMGFFALAAPGKSFVPGDIVTLIELTDPQPEPPEFATWDRGVVDEVQPSAAYALPENINALPRTDGQGSNSTYVVDNFGEAIAQKYVVKDNSADVIGPINWKLAGLQFSGGIGTEDRAQIRWSICADDGAGNPDLTNEIFPASGFDWSTLINDGSFNQEVYVNGTEADFALNNGDTIWILLYYESNPGVAMRSNEYRDNDEDQYCYFEEDYVTVPPEPNTYLRTTNNGADWGPWDDKRYARVGLLLERTTTNNPPSAIFGVCLEPITDSQQGAVTTLGEYVGNTTGAPVGETWELNDQLYINVDNASQYFGKATRVPPEDPLDIIPIGQVLDIDATAGHVVVTCAVTALRGFYMTPGIYDPRSRYRDVFNLDNIDLGTLSSGRIDWDSDVLLTNQAISWYDGDDDTHDVTLPDDLITMYGNISDNAAQIAQNSLDIQTLQATTQWVRTSANFELIVGDPGSASDYNAAPLNIEAALVDTESAVDIVANTVTVTADMILEGVLRWVVVFTPESYSTHSGAFCVFVDGVKVTGQEFSWNAEDVGGGVVHVPQGTTGTTGVQEFNIAALSDGAVVEVRPMVIGNNKTVTVDSYIIDISKSGVVSGKRPAVLVTADRAITVNDDMYELVCNSASPIALTMDAGLPIDFEVVVTRLGTGSVTIEPDPGDNLNGAGDSLVIDNQYEDMRIRRYV